MATRAKVNNSHGTVLRGVFAGSTKKMPVTLDDLKSFTQLGTMDALSLMVDMEEAGLIETEGRGENMVGFIPEATPVVEAPKPATPAKRKRRTPEEMKAARDAEHAKVAYAAARDFELDALSNGADPETAAKGRESVEDELNKEEVKEPVNDAQKDVREALETFYAQASREHMDASNVRDGYVVPEEVKTLPPLPYGVNENTWDMAYNAFSVSERDTLSARLFWIKRALDQHTEALESAFSEALDAS